MPIFAFTALALLLAVSLYALHKLRNVHILLYDVRDQHHNDQAGLFRQLEALQGLYVELDLKHSLPPTRGWAASPDFLLEVARHARTLSQATVLECSSGISTLVLARCMQLNGAGKVYSLEHDRHFAAQTRVQLRRHGLQDWATVIDAPLTPHDIDGQSWPWYDLARLPKLPPIDLLVIDGPPQATRPQARFPAGPLLFPRLNTGAAVFLDDAARPDEQAILLRWRQAFPALAYTNQACEKGCAVLRKH
ncbi:MULTISPECIES: class I SAM-dependent methyltransferase [unclassified Duganella]|uniref:class I SAM-dependent methyltransferase n=1 Tax=unclassified Duganella TaxID=2636909 RepID=UPI000E34503B|nr:MULTISPECIES: class I SAM-dependent methyltransferase [unclassified Duganella]RFP19492.1 class I SAM-dependent methyltransferase [Duganella sp. BJB475]RFP36073.1 class I SAM-dependent methyltransferase [Duganella sp. BJB476]